MTEAERQRIIRLKLCSLADHCVHPGYVVPSGFAGIDAVLGIGGFPRSRIVEISGPAASGKTTIALRAIAAMQRVGGAAAFIDADHAFDARRGAALGVNLERLVLVQPDWGEQALAIVHSLALSGGLDLVVIDSAAALVPRLELDNSLASAPPGLHAAVLGRALRKLVPVAARTGVCILFLNQLRSARATNTSETTSGGPALKAYAAVRAELRPLAAGGKVRFRVIKNKLGRAPQETDIIVR